MGARPFCTQANRLGFGWVHTDPEQDLITYLAWYVRASQLLTVAKNQSSSMFVMVRLLGIWVKGTALF